MRLMQVKSSKAYMSLLISCRYRNLVTSNAVFSFFMQNSPWVACEVRAADRERERPAPVSIRVD